MAEKSGFFNSINGDRKYKADFFAEYFSSFIGNGVFPNPSTNLQILSNGDMTVTLKAGKAWINGYYYNNDTDMVMNIDNADGTLNRIDKIVLRFDVVTRAINVKVKKGSFATAPIPPALQRDANAYELGLADVYINKGVISIIQSNIADLRLDNTKCGLVHGTIDQVDTTTLFNQYQSWLSDKKAQYDSDMTNWSAQKKTEYQTWFNGTTTTDQNAFNTWFNGVKATLSGDVAGNLNNRINSMPIYPLAQGTATAITLDSLDLVDGNSKTFRVAANNNGTATTVNGKPLYKPNTTTPPTLTKGKAVTIWYDLAGDCFFFKASAEGNTIAAHVLANDIFSNDNDTGLVGTMPNQPASVNAVSVGVSTYSPNNRYFRIPSGAYIQSASSGYPEVVATAAQIDSSIISSNIKSGAKIVGVSGSPSVVDTADALATASQLLSGASAYVGGLKISGAMANNGAITIVPGTTAKPIPQGYHNGQGSVATDSNLIANNIKSGVSIFGVAGNVTIGSLGGRRYASGTLTRVPGVMNTINVGFQPVIIFKGNASYENDCMYMAGEASNKFIYFVYGASSGIDGNYVATSTGFTVSAVTSSSFQANGTVSWQIWG